MKIRYYKLVNIIKKHGTPRPKRHGEYIKLKMFGEWYLELDTYNNSIYVYNADTYNYSLGSNWGGFSCDIFWVNFWIAHCKQ